MAPAKPAPKAGAQAGGDFWGETPGAAPEGTAAAAEFSDAIALQLPAAVPEGVTKPYFLFGDASKPVDVWFLELASQKLHQFTGRGSTSLTAVEGGEVEASARYEAGVWSASFARSLRSTTSVSFAEGQYVPIALSVWDGTARERGNRRGITQWFYVYLPPREKPSVVGPMLKAALGVLVLELVVVAALRRKGVPATAA
ncbi:MAG: hypothetical protein ACHP85_07830 [Burkholderiales bacterium]